MLIKTKDSVEPALATLQGLLSLPSLSKEQREAIEEEARNIRSGARGEQQAAYHIDFHLKDSKNYAVVHDLRLEHNGRVAQIDHLIVGRFLDVILIESKNFGTAIRIKADGEFEVKTRYGWKGMASPIEQSRRHARVLLDLLIDLDLAPKRLGFQIRPTFHHWVLVPPECNVSRQAKDATILKMDLFPRHMDAWVDRDQSVFDIAKVLSKETIRGFAEALVAYHQPISMNFAAKFGITLPLENAPSLSENVSPEEANVMGVIPESAKCVCCGVSLEEKVVNFCRLNRNRFNGKLLCRPCQVKSKEIPACAQCGCDVDEKVVAFCRFNSRKFGKRVLCRSCQSNVPSAT